MVEAVFPPERESFETDRSAPHLLRLKARFDGAQGGVVLLRGPRGVGKEQLASELVRYAKQAGHTAIFEGHTPAAGGASFHPFAELARQAMTWAEQNGASEAIVDPILADLHPVLDHLTADREAPPSLDQKLRFFEGVRRLLAAIADRARLVAIVHDLERADGDTLELASYLADNLFADPSLDPGHTTPGLLLLAIRDDRTTPARARDFLAECEERRTVETLRLTGLDLEGIRRYVQSPRVLTKLLAASDGIPQEIDELIDALPSNVEELFERRLEALDPLSQSVLRALALSDRPASARLLATVTGHSVKDVATALSTQREARVLERRIHNGELQFSFSRRSNLEVAVKTTERDELEQLHGGWAKALADGSGDVALLAHHQLRSSEPLRGVPLAIRASEARSVAGAFDAAAQLLEDALPHARGELRLTILGRLSEIASLRGRPREAVRYVEQWKAELPEQERAKALLREAELFNLAGEYEQALARLEEARRTGKGDTAQLRAAIEAAASEALYQLGSLVEARTAGEEGLDLLSSEAGDVSLRARIELLNLLGKIAMSSDDAQRALSLFNATLELAQRSGLGREEARALVNIGHAQMRQGANEEAEASLHLGIEKAQEANDLSSLAFGNLNLGVLAHRRGELGRAIERYRACRSLFQRLGNRTQLGRVLNNLGNLYLQTGEMQRARAHNEEALRLAQAGGVERLVGAAMLLDGILRFEEGDRAAAESRLREAMIHQRRLGAERPLETMVELAKIQLRAGDLEKSREMLGEVQRTLEAGSHPRLSLRARLIEAQLLAASGEAGALDALAAVREELEKLGERLLLRDVELTMGRAYVARGQRETARIHLSAAGAIQKAVAAELPADLRASFETAAAQAEVHEALAELDRPSEPRATVSTRPAAERAASAPAPRPSSPPPAARSSDWQKRYAALVGQSPKLLRVFHILDRIAASDSTVLVVGESGTGKELVAEALHKNSPRARAPFVKLNCAALVESLLLSELFGHERGSFTGAHQRKVGRFEMAAGGTIFLDEIGDISPKTQVALLRVLQEREFERVGGGRPIRLEARVICATNRNLAQMVREGTFREDLYYRLKGLSVELPPLRERPEDIEELANSFLARYGVESGSEQKALSVEAVAMLQRYAWPGNVRELENVVRSVALFADAATIDCRDFDEYRELFEDAPAFERAAAGFAVETEAPRASAAVSNDAAPPRPLFTIPPPPPPAPPSGGVEPAADPEAALLAKIFAEGVPLADLKRRLQEEAIAQALRIAKGNITRAAEMLGMKRPRLSQIINASPELRELCQGVGR